MCPLVRVTLPALGTAVMCSSVSQSNQSRTPNMKVKLKTIKLKISVFQKFRDLPCGCCFISQHRSYLWSYSCSSWHSAKPLLGGILKEKIWILCIIVVVIMMLGVGVALAFKRLVRYDSLQGHYSADNFVFPVS